MCQIAKIEFSKNSQASACMRIVHEDYGTKKGVCLAPAKHATSTHIVLEIDRSRMTFRCEGRKTAMTFTDVMDLREKEISKLKN